MSAAEIPCQMAFVRRRCYAKCQSFHSPIPHAVVEEVCGLIAIFLVEKFRGCNVAAYITYNDSSPLSATATVSAACLFSSLPFQLFAQLGNSSCKFPG